MNDLKRLAVLGTRELRAVRPEVVRTLRTLVESVAAAGGTISTLATPGCNSFAMETALKAGGRVRCYLPLREREASWLRVFRSQYEDRLEVIALDEDLHSRCVEGVRATHQSGRFLSAAATAGLAPMYACLDDVDGALLLTVVRREAHQYTRGSLETAIAMAQARNLPVCDLGDPQQRDGAQQLLMPVLSA